MIAAYIPHIPDCSMLSRSPSPSSVHAVQFHNLRNILVATLPRVYLPDGFTPDEAHPNTNCSIGQV